MSVKEFWEQAINLDAAIASHVAKLDNYRRLAMRIDGSRLEDHVSHSAPNEAPYAKWVERIVDTEKEVDEEIDKLVDVKLAISKFIDGVGNMRWQYILRSRYVMCLPWPQIADELGCSLSTVKRDHNKVLAYLEDEKTVNRYDPIKKLV